MDVTFTVENAGETYEISFTGDVSGSIEAAGIINGDFQNTRVWGEMYINRSDLAMERIVMQMEGEIKRSMTTNSFHVNVEMKQNITSPVSPYDFPIGVGETWEVPTINLWLHVEGEIGLAIPYQINYDLPIYIHRHSLNCDGIENVSVDAGIYRDGYHVADDSNHYEFWYSPSARNTIKLNYQSVRLWHNESTYWDINSMVAWLVSTCYPPGNVPPDPPSSPYPENNATEVETDVKLSWKCSDADGDILRYDIYFGTSPNPPEVKSNHTSNEYNPGNLHSNTTYYWRVVAWDTYKHSSSGPLWRFTTTGENNNPPDKPSRPTGPTSGMINQTYSYYSYTKDKEGDKIYYLFDWGDGNRSKWLGPYESGEICNASHIWKKMGNYTIRVKAKDSHGHESDWSEGLVVSMPLIHPFNIRQFLRDKMGDFIAQIFYLLFPLLFKI